MNIKNQLKQEFGENLKFNEPLKKWTTFRVGGPARYFFIAEKVEDLSKAIEIAKKFKIPYFILGGGSNLLFSDRGYKGIVIKIENCKLKIVNCKVIAGAGVSLSKLVNFSLENNLTGLEWGIGIPGSVGGAIYQNAGAFGSDMSKIIRSVTVFQNGKIKKFSRQNCQFAYRQSIFQKNKAIILEVELELKKGKRAESQKLIKKYLDYRQAKQPVGFSAGSVFKNAKYKIPHPYGRGSPKAARPFGARLAQRSWAAQLKEFEKSGIIPAGWLIEKCGLKGKKIGGAKISEKHANFIINEGRAKAKDVLTLIKKIKKEVYKKFKIRLKEEVEKVGF